MSSKKEQVLFTLLVEHFLFTLDEETRSVFVSSTLPDPSIPTKEKNEILISLVPAKSLNRFQLFAYRLIQTPLFPLKLLDKSLRKSTENGINKNYLLLSHSVQKFLFQKIFPNQQRELDYLLGLMHFIACTDFDINQIPHDDELDNLLINNDLLRNNIKKVKSPFVRYKPPEKITTFEHELLRILSDRFEKLEKHLTRVLSHIRSKKLGKDQYLTFILLKEFRISKFKIEDAFLTIDESSSKKIYLMDTSEDEQKRRGKKNNNNIEDSDLKLISEIRYNRLVKIIVEAILQKRLTKSIDRFRSELFTTLYDLFKKQLILPSVEQLKKKEEEEENEGEEEEKEEENKKIKKSELLKITKEELKHYVFSLMNPFDDNSKFTDFFLSRFVLDHQLQKHNDKVVIQQEQQTSLEIAKEKPFEIVITRIDRKPSNPFSLQVTSSTTIGEIKYQIEKLLASQSFVSDNHVGIINTNSHPFRVGREEVNSNSKKKVSMKDRVPTYIQKLVCVNDTAKRELKENYKTSEMEFLMNGSSLQVSNYFVSGEKVRKKKD